MIEEFDYTEHLQSVEQHNRNLQAEIERLTNVLRATEIERDAGDKVADNLRAEIEQLRGYGRH